MQNNRKGSATFQIYEKCIVSKFFLFQTLTFCSHIARIG